MSCHWSHITKNCLHWNSKLTPRNVELDVELELAQNAQLQHTYDTQSNHTAKGNRDGVL